MSVVKKNKHILGYNVQILQLYSAPNCRESKIQHLTSRVVGTLKYAPGAGHWFYLNYQCSAGSEGINLIVNHVKGTPQAYTLQYSAFQQHPEIFYVIINY